LHKLFGQIWQEEQIPIDWKEGHLIKIPKKGRSQSMFQLQRHNPPVSTRKDLKPSYFGEIGRPSRYQQAGFRQDRSCTDQIATMRIIIKQSMEWNSPLYINFVDYEKAFDSLDRQTLWKLLRHYGVHQKFVSLIQNSYEGM
jgi:hypothetical protein